MTRDALALLVARAERDAAIKRAEEAERQLAAVMEMRERDAPLWDRMGDVAKKLLGTNTVKLLDQRDRALALLRDAIIGRCRHFYAHGWEYSGPCAEDPTCPEHRRRALLAEVGI